MTLHLKQVAFAMALGTAIVATAQTSGTGSSTTTPSVGSPTITNTSPSNTSRVPANKADDATAICANVPASQKEACMARENARKSGTTPDITGSTSKMPNDSPSTGGTDGSSSGASSPGTK